MQDAKRAPKPGRPSGPGAGAAVVALGALMGPLVGLGSSMPRDRRTLALVNGVAGKNRTVTRR